MSQLEESRLEPRIRSGAGTFERWACCGLVVALWAWAWVPQLLDLIHVGRQYPEFGSVAVRSAQADVAYLVIISLILALAVLLIGGHLASNRRVDVGSIVLLTAPWLALSGTYLIQGGRNNEILLFPIVTIAFALSHQALAEILRAVRALTVVTAAVSLVMGLLRPDLFLSDPDRYIANEKALVGEVLLNGLFPASNHLGLALALGAPLLLVARARVRWAGLIVVLAAMLWASSRTAILATVLTFAIWFVATRAGSHRPAVLRAATAGCGLVVLALPFALDDPNSLTRRVAIWQVSLQNATDSAQHILIGLGPMVFREPSAVTSTIGAVASTGHNVMVTLFTAGGAVTLIAAVALWLAMLRRAFDTFDSNSAPLVFLLALTALSASEDPLRAFIIGPASFIISPVLAASFVATGQATGSRDRGGPMASSASGALVEARR